MSILAVIPARLQSTRFPEKPLVPLAGVPLVRRTAERVLAAGRAATVVVSTDDARIARLVDDLPVEVDLDRASYRSGADRVAAAARRRAASVVVDVQVDEVFVDGEVIDAALLAQRRGGIGTVASPLLDAQVHDPHVVKVVMDGDRGGRALDFDRQLPAHWPRSHVAAHAGIYAFDHESLQQFSLLGSAAREERLHLEQLRALDRGWPIFVELVDRELVAVNIPDDAVRAARVLAEATTG